MDFQGVSNHRLALLREKPALPTTMARRFGVTVAGKFKVALFLGSQQMALQYWCRGGSLLGLRQSSIQCHLPKRRCLSLALKAVGLALHPCGPLAVCSSWPALSSLEALAQHALMFTSILVSILELSGCSLSFCLSEILSICPSTSLAV